MSRGSTKEIDATLKGMANAGLIRVSNGSVDLVFASVNENENGTLVAVESLLPLEDLMGLTPAVLRRLELAVDDQAAEKHKFRLSQNAALEKGLLPPTIYDQMYGEGASASHFARVAENERRRAEKEAANALPFSETTVENGEEFPSDDAVSNELNSEAPSDVTEDTETETVPSEQSVSEPQTPKRGKK